MSDYARLEPETWHALMDVRTRFHDDWVFRGQVRDDPPRTSLDRVLLAYGIPGDEVPALERQAIRDFRRRYHGDDEVVVQADSLYCLALMQHYGAPTRLLDVTYSFFVACLFALDATDKPAGPAVIWCFRKAWTVEAAKETVPDIDLRNQDDQRDEASFKQVYFETRKPFVVHENPLRLNNRLVLQQGGFICPGDVRMDLEHNLKALRGWDSDANVVKVLVPSDSGFRRKAMQELLRMNVSRAVLFPGPDGFAAAVRQRLPLLQSLAATGTSQRAT